MVMLRGGACAWTRMVTIVSGAEAGDLAQACEHWVGQTHPGVDVVVYVGGQERYPVLVAVE